MLVQEAEAKVDRSAQRVQELVSDVAKIAGEVGFDPQVRAESVMLYTPEGRHEGDVVVWSSGERLTVESNRQGSRTTHIHVEAAGCGRDGWYSKLRTALRFRAQRAAKEAAANAAYRANEERKEANKRRGLERLGALPPDVEVDYLSCGAWNVKLDTDYSTIEDAEALVFALRLTSSFRWRRLWKEGVGYQRDALKSTRERVALEVSGDDSLPDNAVVVLVTRAVRSQLQGQPEVTRADIDARFVADRAVRSRVNLALNGVCATPICGATRRYCQLEPGHAGEHSVFPTSPKRSSTASR